MVVPCSTCGQPIEWVTTAAGRPMPLDVEPAYGGGITLQTDLFGGVVALVTPRTGTRRCHFASCPDADAHRRLAGLTRR